MTESRGFICAPSFLVFHRY